MFHGLWLQMRWLWDRSWTGHCREAMWLASRVKLCPWVDTSLCNTLFTLLELRHVPPADQVIQKQATCVHDRAVLCVLSVISPRKKNKLEPICCSVKLVESFSSSHTTVFSPSMVLPDLKIQQETAGCKSLERCSRAHLLQIHLSKQDACHTAVQCLMAL